MNKCDLEELRHAAVQQILESATQHPEKWTRYFCPLTLTRGRRRGKFYLTRSHYKGVTETAAYFNDEFVGSSCVNYNAKYPSPEYAVERYTTYKDHPVTRAWEAIAEYELTREHEGYCQRLAKAMGVTVDNPEPNALWTRIKGWWNKRGKA